MPNPPDTNASESVRSGTPLNGSSRVARVPVMALGNSLGAFLGITYLLCVGFDLLFPDHAMYRVWAPLLPGFDWLTWPCFFLGLVESVAYGWYIALVFGPLYNFFASRKG